VDWLVAALNGGPLRVAGEIRYDHTIDGSYQSFCWSGKGLSAIAEDLP